MHPAIRLLAVVLITGFAATAKPVVLCGIGICLLVAQFSLANVSFQLVLRTIWRLRFFYISILIIYGWLGTPGSLEQVSFAPQVSGLYEGLLRIVALSVMAWAVSLFLQSTLRDDIVNALLWWLRPLSVFGRFDLKLAVRLTLVLQVFESLSEDLKETSIRKQDNKTLSAWLTGMADVFINVLLKAEKTEASVITLQTLSVPGIFQWLTILLFSLLLTTLLVYV